MSYVPVCPSGYALASDGMCDQTYAGVGFFGTYGEKARNCPAGSRWDARNGRCVRSPSAMLAARHAMLVKSTDLLAKQTDSNATCGADSATVISALNQLEVAPKIPIDIQWDERVFHAFDVIGQAAGLSPLGGKWPTSAHCGALIDALKEAEDKAAAVVAAAAAALAQQQQQQQQNTTSGEKNDYNTVLPEAEEKVDYTPWLIGGAVVVLGGGLLWYSMSQKKR